ncbi:MAG: hypothetical protein AB7P76_03035 [Candidatus Melainabacteria bacterium]
MDISNSGIQRLQLQQSLGISPRALRPRQDAAPAADRRIETPAPAGGSAVQSLRNKLPIADIQATAARVGYVDVTEGDIINAYRFGQSLLSDYRV